MVLVLSDARNPEWDRAVSNHMLDAHQQVGRISTALLPK